MRSWFEDTIIEHERLPLLVCFAAFIVTFIATRVITRMIRAGRGPFKNNVSASGLHVHHAIPGVILLVAGAFTGIAVDLESPWSIVAGLLIGVGTSLVLDEFALILHMEDVYWEDEGRISVEMVSLAVACLGLLIAGANPFKLQEPEDATLALAGVGGIIVHLAFIVGCVVKGKYRMAIIGTLVPFVAVVGAIRLARPHSIWAKRRYQPAKTTRAVDRAAHDDARWGPRMYWLADFVAGEPSGAAASRAVTPPTAAPPP
ncbi:MAG: hypothetical protein ACR2HQ_13990 [Ilumatobacteraceae bacterium]